MSTFSSQIEKTAKVIKREPFAPDVFYNQDGDCIEFVFSPEAYYQKRLDEWVTLYLDLKTDELVGSMLKHVSRLKKMPFFLVTIQHGKVRLDHLFMATATLNNKKDASIIYQKLVEAAVTARAETKLVEV